MVYLVSGLPLGVVSFIVAVGGTVAGVVLLPLALVGVPVLVGALALCGSLGSLERQRVVLMLDRAIPPPVRPTPERPGLWPRAPLS